MPKTTKKGPITLLAVGDILIDREEPNTILKHVGHVLRSADITVCNMEQMCSDKGHPSPHATYSDPKNISALLYAGFDVVSLANNHTLGHGTEALLDTMERFKKAGIQYVGVGRNLAEARQPVIIEKGGNKIGFLAYCCIGPSGYEATESRPGHAPMRAWTLYNQVDYQPGTPPQILTFPNKEDLAAMQNDVRKLKAQVDVAITFFHWGIHHRPRVIPMYEFDIAHAAIDAGADVILGIHAHILKGIEVYKNKCIFHSLNNFALELGARGNARKDLARYMKELRKLYGFKLDPEYPTYPMHPEAKATMIGKVAIENGKVHEVSYLPCYINKNAEPEILTRNEAKSEEVFRYVKSISRSEKLAVRFKWDGDQVVITGR